ncbi:MAG: class II glutamine amidotransferase [Myxococcota bacterium]
MARLIGIMANRRDRMAAIAHQERKVVEVDQSSPSGGFGVGFYQGDEVLHKKRPRTKSDLNWKGIVGDVRSDCAVLHAREATVGDHRSENTHPFRLRSWLFAHVGTLERFEAIRDNMRAAVPEFLTRNIRGQTDSELLFHLVLSFLHDAGQLDNRDVSADDVSLALRSAIALVDRLSAEVGAPTPQFGLVLTNGRLMAATGRGLPMTYVERDGLHDPPEGVSPADPDDPKRLRYVLIAARESPGEQYVLLPENDTLVVDRDIGVHRIS